MTPQKLKNIILLIGSIIFYILGSIGYPQYVLLIILSIIINYFFANLIDKTKKKIFLIIGLMYNLGWLFLFKYLDFILEIINYKNFNLLLPIGISFYTFQSISYLIDVYKQKYHSEKSIIKFGTYILMFPQLISGPLVSYSTIEKQLAQRRHSVEKIAEGLKYFIVGLGFKVLLADVLGILWNDIFVIGIESISTILAWIGAIAYSLEIYFDFCGYSLMAIGIGKLMGFELPTNFDTPYLSKSMVEFFRRWHITLGKWFKEYVYIPLGGNRKGILRTILNLGIVWLLTGLWHGSTLNFILWGLFVFFIITIEKIFLKEKLEKHSILSHIYMIFLIVFMWTIFAITDIKQLGIMINKMFVFSFGINKLDFVKYLTKYGIFIILGFIFTTKLPYKYILNKNLNYILIVMLLITFLASIYYVYQGLNNPFLYFNF